jgi:hypothetical protein
MRRSFIVGTAITLVATVVVGQAYSQGGDQAFEALPACEQLKIISEKGESLPQYISGSGFDQFALPVVDQCPQYLDALAAAWEIVIESPQSGDLAFERLSACEKLFVVEDRNGSVADFIVQSGFESFARPIVSGCPRHLAELSEAWKRSQEGVGNGTPIPFSELPACTQLNRIQQDGKSVSDYIAGSGIDNYASDIRTQCPQYVPDLTEAERILGRARNQALNPTFESLAPCQKLDVIQGEGKSVPQYIADSGLEDFASDIYGMCTRHIANFEQAQRILGASR